MARARDVGDSSDATPYGGPLSPNASLRYNNKKKNALFPRAATTVGSSVQVPGNRPLERSPFHVSSRIYDRPLGYSVKFVGAVGHPNGKPARSRSGYSDLERPGKAARTVASMAGF